MPIRDTQDAKLIVLVHLGGFEDKRCGRYRILDYRRRYFSDSEVARQRKIFRILSEVTWVSSYRPQYKNTQSGYFYIVDDTGFEPVTPAM